MITCVISCSFRFLDQIADLITKLEAVGVKVLAPKDTVVKKSIDGFVILEADKTDDPGDLTKNFWYDIREADFLYVMIPSGIIGASVAAEIYWAHYHNIPIIISASPKGFSDSVEKEFVRQFGFYLFSGALTPRQLVGRIKRGVVTKEMLVEMKKRAEEQTQAFFNLFGLFSKPLEIVKKT